MNEFISVFGTALIIISAIGFIIGGLLMIVEKSPLKEKMSNFFGEINEK